MSFLLLTLALLVLSGCGGGQRTMTGPAGVQTTASFGQGPILVQHIAYTTFDGTRVPALFSIPRGVTPRGCLIFQHGFGGSKEESEALWGGAARLGLAVFAIDLRDHGQRATTPNERFEALRSVTRWRGLVAGSVKDLERGVDYLWAQASCRHNIGYLGVSLGGMVGAVFTAQDPRVHAVALLSAPPSYKALIEGSNRLCSEPVRPAGVQCTNVLLPGITNHPAQLAAALRMLSPLDPDRWLGKISPRPLLLMFGTQDPINPPQWTRLATAAARQPKTVVYYNGSHNPFAGAAAASNDGEIGLFFLNDLVRPTYGDNFPKPLSGDRVTAGS